MSLLPKVERYLKRTGTKPSNFGREAMGDPGFVFQLRRGREPFPQTVDRVERYLKEREA